MFWPKDDRFRWWGGNIVVEFETGSSSYNLDADIVHLHQLQNLIHIITGKEL